MDQNLFELLTLLVAFVSALALGGVLNGVMELAFFRARDIGLAANRRKQYVTTVVKAVLSAGAAALTALLFVNPGIWQKVVPELATYSPALSLIALAIVAVVSYRLEVASEVPGTLHDLHTDLRKFWAEEEILSKHSLARHQSWLKGLTATTGGRSMMSSKRPLDPRLQAAIDESLSGNYRDVRFARLARRTTLQIVRYMIQGHPWRTLWSFLPFIVAVLGVALLTTNRAVESYPATPRLIVVSVAAIVIGILFSAFNIWARSTSGLRKYCDLKRREELCTLLLTRLKLLAEPAKATPGQHQQNPPGLIRRFFRAVW